MKKTILIGFLFSCKIILAQNHPYLFRSQIDSMLQKDTTPWKYQTASWNYSYIGEYQLALEMKDKQYPNAKVNQASEKQISILKNYHAIDARKAILKAAKQTRVLILNEAHYSALHRVYLTRLLSDLYALGYRFIGMETLNYSDSLLNQRKYPIINSGFYSKEPCFGNLIREALQIGFTIFPYEQIYTDKYQGSLGREKAEAMNIKKKLEEYSKDKFIIYCGYDHAAEDTLRNIMGLPMAGQVKNLCGIDPFTIDQTALSEYVIVGNSYRKLMHQQTDVLYVDASGHYFNQANLPKNMDCNLYHPSTRYKHNRPYWLKRKNTKLVCLTPKIHIDFPYLIKIFLETDDLNIAVPIDVVEIRTPDDRKASLIYKHKKQVAVIENYKGEKQLIQLK